MEQGRTLSEHLPSVSNCGQNRTKLSGINRGMGANTLLCIHRDPAQLSLLQENGYELVTATNGHEGLRLFMSRAVDAIVLEYHLGLLNGAVIAAEIKQVRPEVPISCWPIPWSCLRAHWSPWMRC